LTSASWSGKFNRSSAKARSPERANSKWAVATILYIEDNDDNIYVVKNRFARAGYTVLVATDGEQGVAKAAAERPDLILMDLRLPVLDGWEATRRIKAQPETRHIPIIAFTAHAMTGDREKALAAGCDDFDTKPVEMPRLLSKVRALLSKDETP
jgi:two-component system cell cycle response regulator DivK